MKDELCFLNEPDFADQLDNDFLENWCGLKKMMVRDIEDYITSKRLHALNVMFWIIV